MKSNNDYTNDTKIALLQQNNDHIHETLHRIETNLNNLAIELRKEINDVKKESFSHFKWLVGIVIFFSGSPLITESIKLLISYLKAHQFL